MSIDFNPIKKNCSRFKSQSDPHYNFPCDKAITYLKLRSEGCDKKTAAQFSLKPQCRIDPTRVKFGPPQQRVLMPVVDSKVVEHGGWTNQENVRYYMGNKYFPSVQAVLGDKKLENDMQSKLNINENIVKEDFKVQMKQLTNFYSVLNDKYQYSGCEKQELLGKLKQLQLLNAQNNQRQAKYIEIGRQKLFEIVDDYASVQQQLETPINKLKAFPQFIVDNESNIQIRLKEKSVFQMTKDLKNTNNQDKVDQTNQKSSNNKDYLDSQSKIEELKQENTLQTILNIQEQALKQEEENIQIRQQSIQQLIKDGNYVINITQTEDLTDPAVKLKMKHNLDKYYIGSQKASMADEFNNSNYITQIQKMKNNELYVRNTQLSQPVYKGKLLSLNSSVVEIKKRQSSLHKSPQKLKQRALIEEIESSLKRQSASKIVNLNRNNLQQWDKFRQNINEFVAEQISFINQKNNALKVKIDNKNFENMQRNIDDIKKKFNHRCYGSVNNSTSPSNVKRENYFYVKFKQIDSLFQKSNKQIHSSLQNKLLKDDSEQKYLNSGHKNQNKDQFQTNFLQQNIIKVNKYPLISLKKNLCVSSKYF